MYPSLSCHNSPKVLFNDSKQTSSHFGLVVPVLVGVLLSDPCVVGEPLSDACVVDGFFISRVLRRVIIIEPICDSIVV